MKKLGISIDGVIRNYIDAFDKQYRKAFIFNESIVETNDEFELKPPTAQDLEEKTKKIEEKAKNLISLPVDSHDLLNHYQFNEIKEFEVENTFKPEEENIIFDNFKSFDNKILTPQEALNKFMYETHPFKIFGDSEEYKNAMSYFNRIQNYGLQNDLFETVLISDLKANAITANYFFLHKTGSRARNIQVVKDSADKWNYCDVLVDVSPEAFQSKPDGKTSIKIDRPYNQYDEADYTLKDLKDVNNEMLLKKLFENK